MNSLTSSNNGRYAFAAIVAAAYGCGGIAVIDGQGEGGGGAGGTSTSVTQASSSTGATACEALDALLLAAVEEAQACNPNIDIPQCSGTNLILDQCDCKLVAGDDNLTAANTALTVQQQWVAAGCGPLDCTFCPSLPPDELWFCSPDTSTCTPP